MSSAGKINFNRYFLCFLAYAVIGWAYEVFLEVVVYRWGYSDRGVLFGPYCPIYGFGALVFIFCLRPLFRAKLHPLLRLPLVFLGCMLTATAIELAASYLLEALTGSWPWQTYDDYKINFQARIALSPSVRFGLGGILFLYVLQPLFEKALDAIGEARYTKAARLLASLFAADVAVNAVLLLKSLIFK